MAVQINRKCQTPCLVWIDSQVQRTVDLMAWLEPAAIIGNPDAPSFLRFETALLLRVLFVDAFLI